ncbi:MAG: hypothetical protein BMS9Abin11_1582 [Gammaproteobacteria bacterium]|nr:MAG: hypothetical protein BMS9Abin11_1582 [Gammaproteobacteria bacterium]
MGKVRVRRPAVKIPKEDVLYTAGLKKGMEIATEKLVARMNELQCRVFAMEIELDKLSSRPPHRSFVGCDFSGTAIYNKSI